MLTQLLQLERILTQKLSTNLATMAAGREQWTRALAALFLIILDGQREAVRFTERADE